MQGEGECCMSEQTQDIFGKYDCHDCKDRCHFFNVNTEKEQAKIQHVTMNVGCMLRASRGSSPAETIGAIIKFIDFDHSAPLDYVTCQRIKKYADSLRNGGEP